ncbi:RNA polymerase sigma factor [Methylotenera mobilis]|uniref:RNA polymerase, sigma-24 subunit, ECF subfamily n=1 Tax=Methylotenera mobilis (strain JLW8 / ATCC BAA-1282 / DSM 17540) TaxID=583345 RepID=C6WT51_METML|nr:RNA polymerase sigma factor [Methylotenera mobilis]ACT49113.1 RNA polymerase, sigma-24 subunit, ECF subfamily [Methylotenera mobilis JLW8]
MATPKELSDFLAAIERRAFKQTAYAVRDDHAALDIVQDAMMKLADKYGAQPASEFPMLFQRILQNTMRDYWRRQKVRNLWTTLLSAFGGSGEDNEDRDPLDTIDVGDDSEEPSAQIARSQTIQLIERALEKLPARQREAFVLRYWEEMDVAETAEIMGCSDGSVKTHCSRAVHALATELRKQGLDKLGLSNHGTNPNHGSK